jgi:hypothetical protein
MTKDEALKLALEALESSRVFVTTREKIKHPEGTEWYDQAITAIKEALAQPEQEPVAIVEVFGKDWRLEYMSLPVGKHNLYTQQYIYTTPPKHTWVGLTDEEMMDAIYVDDTPMERGRRVESKLRSKNNG